MADKHWYRERQYRDPFAKVGAKLPRAQVIQEDEIIIIHAGAYQSKQKKAAQIIAAKYSGEKIVF